MEHHPVSMWTLLLILWLCPAVNTDTVVRWCAVKGPEMRKCLDMKSNMSASGLNMDCVQGMHEVQCLRLIQAGEADVRSVRDRGIYTGGKFAGLKPIYSETRQDTAGTYFYKAVIVLKKSNKNIRNITDVKNKRSCHTGVMRTVGWVVPMGVLFAHGGMAAIDCDNNVKNIGNYFSQSCCPGAYDPYNNPDGKNPDNVCKSCADKRCPFSGGTYSGYTGAFRGVVDGVCDIGFVKHSTVPTDAKGKFSYNKEDYQLLCPNGRRASVDDWPTCNWATRPHNALVARSNYTAGPLGDLLTRVVQLFGPKGSKKEKFQLFGSAKYGGKHLMFSDSSTSFTYSTATNYSTYLGDGFVNSYAKFRPDRCQKKFRWCTLTDAETRKCYEMQMALAGGRITQDMTCVQGKSIEDCFSKIQKDQADLITVDAGHVYIGGKYMNMRPITAELYNDKDKVASSYYSVAIIKKGSNIDLTKMKGKKTCHTGFERTAGWNVPMGYFADRTDIILDESRCNVAQAAVKFFGAMCTPGALEGEKGKSNPPKLCSLCPDNCQYKGKYGGYAEAVKCLKEKNADVAFAKHTTIDDILQGGYDWARGWKKSDFELACRDGTRKPVDQWQTCNLARVPSHAVVTSTKRSAALVHHYQIALFRAQHSRRYREDSHSFFALFSSEMGQSNLLFKDSTKALLKVDQSYEKFLGKEYLKTVEALDTRKCSASTMQVSLLAAFPFALLYLVN